MRIMKKHWANYIIIIIIIIIIYCTYIHTVLYFSWGKSCGTEPIIMDLSILNVC